MKLKKKLEVLKKRKRKLYPSLVHASAAKKNLRLRSNRIVVTFALCKDAKIVCIRNILTPNPLIRRVKCVKKEVFAEFAKLSSISNKYE